MYNFFHNTILYKVLLVTGGWGPGDEYLTSTEVYYPSAGKWREVPGALPRPMVGLRLVTLNNKVLLFGEMREWVT